MAVVFRQEHEGGLFDLVIDGRAGEYDLEPDEFSGALQRRRVKRGTEIYQEDETGHRMRILRRW